MATATATAPTAFNFGILKTPRQRLQRLARLAQGIAAAQQKLAPLANEFSALLAHHVALEDQAGNGSGK